MNQRRRQFLISSLVAGLAACTAKPTVGSRRLTFWTMQLQPTFTDYLNEVLKAFQEAYPGVTVDWVDVPWGDMENKILAAFAGGTAPDVVNLNPQFATRLAEKKVLLDLGSLITPEVKASYFPGLWQANQLGQVTFGVPWYVSTDVTFYNRDLLSKAGVNQPPVTYSDLATVGAIIKRETGKYALLPTMDGSQLLEAMVQMGFVLLTPEGKPGFDTQTGRDVFTYWVTLFKEGIIPREVLTEGHRRAIELYQAGELALLSTGPQLFKQIQENAPDVAATTDVAPQLIGVTQRTSASVMNIVVNQRTSHSPEAVNLALWITNASNQLSFAQTASILPSTLASLEDPYFSGTTTNPLDKARAISASQLPSAEVLIPPVIGLDELRQAIYAELQAAMLEQKSVDEAVTTAAQRWSKSR